MQLLPVIYTVPSKPRVPVGVRANQAHDASIIQRRVSPGNRVIASHARLICKSRRLRVAVRMHQHVANGTVVAFASDMKAQPHAIVHGKLCDTVKIRFQCFIPFSHLS